MNGDPAAGKAIDRFPVQELGRSAVAEQRARPGQYAEGPIRADGLGAFLELSQGGHGDLASIASSGRLDELDEGESKDPQDLVLGRSPCAGQGGLVPAKAVVQHRSQVGGSADRSSLSSGDRVPGVGLKQLRRLSLPAAPDGEQHRGVSQWCVARRLRERVGLLDELGGRRELSCVPLFPDLVGFSPLPIGWQLDFAQVFNMPGRPPAQRAKRLDGGLAASLIGLPEQLTGPVDTAAHHSLAVRDLLRGETTALPSGEAIARTIGAEPLSACEVEHTWPHGTPCGSTSSRRPSVAVVATASARSAVGSWQRFSSGCCAPIRPAT
jgi:hypothetical protein